MSNPAEIRAHEPLDAGAWKPLRRPVFRALWIATIASAIGTWMQDVGASWLMTSLAPTPLLVSLVQAASNLPFFVLALPAGALADLVDRRRLLMVSQAWMLLSAAALGILTLSGAVTPVSLLLLTFCLGVGSALNAPAWQAITPELVPREELPDAISLNGMAMNVARAAGPALGGAVVAIVGSGPTFLLNAASFLGVIAVLARWERPRRESRLPPEDLYGAIRAGIRYVRHSTQLTTVLVRALSFILCGSVVWALLPLFARETLGLGPSGYGALLGFFGAGAVSGAFLLPRLRRALSAERVATGSVLAFAAVTLVLGLARDGKLVGIALVIGGAAWLILLSSLNLAAQSAVPSWVRARAMAVHLLVIFGGMAIGSAFWGAIATFIDIPAAFELAT
ncbi:MAG TPA: MFS transporter, partial [Myxococcota bacterium]|nr:MFS transporter [Myxococcota bacterium]